MVRQHADIFAQTNAVGAAGDFKTKAELKTFTFSTNASDWQILNFTSGTSMSLGSVLSSDLPAGDITAFGLYTNYKTKTFRFDTYEIQADPIPEPPHWACWAWAAFRCCVGGNGR